MKKKLLVFTMCLLSSFTYAQKLIPFQYQNEQKWNYQEKWGLMTTDRKIVLPPTYYSIAPKIVEETFMILGNKILELKTGKIVWDSIEAKGVDKVVGNIVSIKMPLRGAVNYQPYSFKNIKTKKLIAQEGRWAPVAGFVVTEGSGAEGVVDENGKEIIKQTIYQNISYSTKECFVATNDYEGYKYIYDLKGNKLNTKSYDQLEIGNGKKQLIIAFNKIEKNKNVYEVIFINALGKEVGQHLFCVINGEYFNPFEFTNTNLAIKKKDVSLFKNKLCDEAGRISNSIVVNQDGKIIIDEKNVVDIKEIKNNLITPKSEDLKTTTFYNSNGSLLFTTKAFTNVDFLGTNLFFATDTLDGKKYFVNGKGEKLVNGASFTASNWIKYNEGTGFLIYKKEYNKLFFNTYNAKSGVSKFGEQVVLETGILVNDIATTNGKYYLVNVTDNNKKQYATYIYDITGNLVQKSENGLWMYVDEQFIKYTLNSKNDKFYIGYYDNDLKPYSIVSN